MNSNLNYEDVDAGHGFFNKYNDDELKFILQHILENSNDVDKRGFDRLTSGFIRRKRSPDANAEHVTTNKRRKRSTNEIGTGPIVVQSEKAIQSDENNVDGIEENKRTDETFFALQRNKKGFDRLASSFVKKDDSKDSADSYINADSDSEFESQVVKSTLVDEDLNAKNDFSSESKDKPESSSQDSDNDDGDDHDNVKRRFDRLASSFVKRRGFDRLTSGFVKRRGFDRLTSGFVKKDNAKRRFDRLTSGFVKKDDQKRRGFDRLTSGFVKKSSDVDFIDDDEAALNDLYAEKRRFDRLTSGFVKKDNDKRYIDRMTSGFVKKDNDKRRFDRVTSGFVKKDADKRYLGRLNSGFVKKDQEKRYFGRLNSGFVKKGADKRYFGRLNSGFVKKDQAEKIDEDTSDEMSDSGIWHAANDNLNGQNLDETEKRRIDRVAYGFIKREDDTPSFVPEIGTADSELQKRYFGRMTSGFVKKDQTDKRRFDRLYSGFVKRQYSENPYIDRNMFDSGNGVINDPSDLYSSDSDVSKLFGGSGNKDVNMPDTPLNRKRRSVYGNDRDVFPLTGNGFVAGNGYDVNDDNYVMGRGVNELQKRRLDRLFSGFVKKRSPTDSNKSMSDTIRHGTDNQREAITKTDDANLHLL